MPYGAHVFSHLEDALSEAFQYHDGLDAFLGRAGIPAARLARARDRAEARAKASRTRNYNRAPKRFVAQELLKDLQVGGDGEDRLVAGLVTALCKSTFREAGPQAFTAIATLKTLTQAERDEAEARREELRQKEREKEREREREMVKDATAREDFKERFLQLSAHQDPQARGYMLEKFLNDFFAFEGLNPRGSFKLIGEQIDGSFAWAGRTYLVEARWVSKPIGGAGFSSLMYKIEGKTADTRGLFIAINGYSPESLKGLKQKGRLYFVCIDGAHLMRCLEPGGSLSQLLERICRHADETGEAYLPVSEMVA
jgi:hypothetical protein